MLNFTIKLVGINFIGMAFFFLWRLRLKFTYFTHTKNIFQLIKNNSNEIKKIHIKSMQKKVLE